MTLKRKLLARRNSTFTPVSYYSICIFFIFTLKKIIGVNSNRWHEKKKWKTFYTISSFILLSSGVEMEKSCHNILFPWFITHFVRYFEFDKKYLKMCASLKKSFSPKKKKKGTDKCLLNFR